MTKGFLACNCSLVNRDYVKVKVKVQRSLVPRLGAASVYDLGTRLYIFGASTHARAFRVVALVEWSLRCTTLTLLPEKICSSFLEH